MRKRDLAAGLLLAHLGGAACGASQPAAAGPPPAASAPESPRETEPPASETAASAPVAEEATKEPAGKPAEEPRGRNITYRPTSSGLVIELDGLRLEPTTQIKQVGGGHQLTLLMRVTSTDDGLHRFLKSTSGVFMVAGELDRGGGNKERFGDKRTGDAEEYVSPGDPVELTRAIEPIVKGKQSLTLHVGLWGLGRDAEERRPVKRLFIVKVVPGERQPAAVIIPPE